MTPAEEKAKELIEWFNLTLFGKKPFYKKSDTFKSKQCAIKVCDEILTSKKLFLESVNYNFWQKVKTAINNYE